MSDQSDAPVSTEPSDHVVTIPPELPDHIVTISPSDRIFSFNIGEYPWEQLIAPQLCLRDSIWMNFDLPASRANQSEHDEDEDTPASPGIRFSPRFWDTWMHSDLLEPQANQRHGSWLAYFQQESRVYQRSVELMKYQGWMLESLPFEDLDSLTLPRQQTREVWYDGWNGYGHPGDRYTVIGLISTISCAIYSILFGLTGQMYKEEDGSFFSHHQVMVTISMLSMVYAAFSGVFLCVIYYLAAADPTHTYRRRMRFLSGTFVSAACFGPAVMFMAMFVGPLGFKVFAWAVLGAALTRVGFYIRG